MLHIVDWQFVTDVSGQPIGPIFRGQKSFSFGFLNPEDGTDSLNRTSLRNTTTLSVTTQKRVILSYFAVEARILANLAHILVEITIYPFIH
jgi:hypothetical protein